MEVVLSIIMLTIVLVETKSPGLDSSIDTSLSRDIRKGEKVEGTHLSRKRRYVVFPLGSHFAVSII